MLSPDQLHFDLGPSPANQPGQSIAVVIPVFNEGERLLKLIIRFQQDTRWAEVIIIDASDDEVSHQIHMQARDLVELDSRIQLVRAAVGGRAAQMNEGARLSRAEVLLFLHADTQLPSSASSQILTHLNHMGNKPLGDGRWGRFDVHFDSLRWPFRLIAFMMNWRSALSGICTGDQALFMHRTLFDKVGGFPEIKLMEDIEISRRLKHFSQPVRIRQSVETSARRWQQMGTTRTILLMWGVRLAYWLGVEPARLASWYQHAR